MTQEQFDRFTAALEQMRRRQEEDDAESRRRQEQYEAERRQRDEHFERRQQKFDEDLQNLNQFLMNMAAAHAHDHAEMRANLEEYQRQTEEYRRQAEEYRRQCQEEHRQMRAETRALRREGVQAYRRLLETQRVTDQKLQAFIDSLRRGGDGRGPAYE